MQHLIASIGSLLLVLLAALVQEAGVRASSRQGSIAWGYHGAALALWALAGFVLARPVSGARRQRKADWGIALPYLVPGLIAALALPGYYLAGSVGVPVLGWTDGFVRYGGNLLGALLVGYGLGLAQRSSP